MEAIDLLLLDEPGPFIVRVVRRPFGGIGYLIRDYFQGSVASSKERAAVHATRAEAEAYRDRWIKSWDYGRTPYPDSWELVIVRPEDV